MPNSIKRGIRARLVALTKFHILHVANDCTTKHGDTRHPTGSRRPVKRFLTNRAWFSPHLRRPYKYKCCRGERREIYVHLRHVTLNASLKVWSSTMEYNNRDDLRKCALSGNDHWTQRGKWLVEFTTHYVKDCSYPLISLPQIYKFIYK